MDTLEDVLQLWLSKPEFRAEFKKDPQAALQMEGLELSTKDLNTIKAYIQDKDEGVDGSGNNEELDKRINK